MDDDCEGLRREGAEKFGSVKYQGLNMAVYTLFHDK